MSMMEPLRLLSLAYIERQLIKYIETVNKIADNEKLAMLTHKSTKINFWIKLH